MKLKDKVAIVTGGARGIGRAICERYVEEGARVFIADLQLDLARDAAEAIGGRAEAIEVNVADLASINRMVAQVATKTSGIDILVNNAALFDLAPIVEVNEKGFDKIFAVNVKGLFFSLQTVARHMIARGQGGKIINMASQAGRRGEALVSIYCASKAAVISLTQSAGLDLIKHKINVNGIAPGVVDTPMWDEVDLAIREIRKPQARREEEACRPSRAVRSHGLAGRSRRRRSLSRLLRRRLCRRSDAECRWRQLDELSRERSTSLRGAKRRSNLLTGFALYERNGMGRFARHVRYRILAPVPRSGTVKPRVADSPSTSSGACAVPSKTPKILRKNPGVTAERTFSDRFGAVAGPEIR